MPLPWNIHEPLITDHYAELLREAQNERRIKEARGDETGSPAWPRLFSWLGEQVSSWRRRSEARTSQPQTLASQKQSYLDNPDPFRSCVTC
jgi:hypothetical protein